MKSRLKRVTAVTLCPQIALSAYFSRAFGEQALGASYLRQPLTCSPVLLKGHNSYFCPRKVTLGADISFCPPTWINTGEPVKAKHLC